LTLPVEGISPLCASLKKETSLGHFSEEKPQCKRCSFSKREAAAYLRLSETSIMRLMTAAQLPDPSQILFRSFS